MLWSFTAPALCFFSAREHCPELSEASRKGWQRSSSSRVSPLRFSGGGKPTKTSSDLFQQGKLGQKVVWFSEITGSIRPDGPTFFSLFSVLIRVLFLSAEEMGNAWRWILSPNFLPLVQPYRNKCSPSLHDFLRASELNEAFRIHEHGGDVNLNTDVFFKISPWEVIRLKTTTLTRRKSQVYENSLHYILYIGFNNTSQNFARVYLKLPTFLERHKKPHRRYKLSSILLFLC